MNLREKFLWNVAIAFSVLALSWNTWNLYSKNINVKKAYNKYKNEKVGSDKELQNMVIDLEENLNDRKMLKFKIKENPLDLMKVISLDGSFTSGGTAKKGIDCKMAWCNESGDCSALCNYKSKRFEVSVGDSIGGGIIKEITSSQVFIEKDNQNISFNFGLDKY